MPPSPHSVSLLRLTVVGVPCLWGGGLHGRGGKPDGPLSTDPRSTGSCQCFRSLRGNDNGLQAFNPICIAHPLLL